MLVFSWLFFLSAGSIVFIEIMSSPGLYYLNHERAVNDLNLTVDKDSQSPRTQFSIALLRVAAFRYLYNEPDLVL